MFVWLLTSAINAFNHAKCVSLNNQQCKAQHTLIKLHPNEYSKCLHYYPFAFNLEGWVGSCNSFNEVTNKVSVTSKTEDLF